MAIVTDPADYAMVASRVADGTGFSLDERKWLAAKAFAHTAAYDATINESDRQALAQAGLSGRRRGGQGRSGTEVDSAKFPAQFTRTWIVRTPCATARTPTSRPPSTSTRSTRPVSPTPSSSAASR